MNPNTRRTINNFARNLAALGSPFAFYSKDSLLARTQPDVPEPKKKFEVYSTPRPEKAHAWTQWWNEDLALWRKERNHQWSNRRRKRHRELKKRRERAAMKRICAQVDMDMQRVFMGIDFGSTPSYGGRYTWENLPSKVRDARVFEGIHMPGGDSERQTGRSTRQMEAAPQGATYVWPNDMLSYPDMLKERTSRPDLNLISLHQLNWMLERGMHMDTVVIDHAAEDLMTVRDRERLGLVRRVFGLGWNS